MFDSDDMLGEWHGRSELQDFATYALMVQCMLAAEGVKITASFDMRVIERWQVKKMLGQFSSVMQHPYPSPFQTVHCGIPSGGCCARHDLRRR